MKNNKYLTLAILLPFLTSCGEVPYVGEYVFQMGKSKDTHIGVSLKLSDEQFDLEDKEKGDKFELNIDLTTSSSVESDFVNLLKALNPITGFYTVMDTEKVYDGTRLNLGISLLGEVDVPVSLTQLLFVANIDPNMVNFYLPVSMTDLIYQLYWYGYDIDMAKYIEDQSVNPLDTPEGKHPVGTHPTQADIDQINTHYATDHNDKVFRDYHVLKLGLTKL